MKVEHLALNILHNDKMSAEDIIKHIASAIDEDIDCSQEYKELYESAYGEKLSNDILVEWVKSMAITDGNTERSNGQKWTVEQCMDYANKLNVDWNKITKYEWYAVMNMEYSDKYMTAKRFGLQEDPMYFASSAKDFLCDKDSKDEPSERLYKYYFNLVV